MSNKFLVLALASAAVLPASSFALGNIVLNSSFETYDTTKASGTGAGFATYLAGSTGISNWSVGLVSVDIVTPPYMIHSGNAALDLAGTPGPGSVSQSLATTNGQSYTVSVWSYGTDATNQQFVMTFGGTSHTFTTTAAYAQYSFTATATSASTLLTLATQATNTTNGNDIVDDVSVQAVPEPASMAALGLGVVALIRRKRSIK